MGRKNSFKIDKKDLNLKIIGDRMSSIESDRLMRNISATLINGIGSKLEEENTDDNPLNVKKLFTFAESKHTSTLHNIYSSYSKKLSDYLIKNNDNILLYGNSKYLHKNAKFYLEDKKSTQQHSLVII